MAVSTSSKEDLAIPYEWVDEEEFQALENAFSEATSVHKRIKISASDDVAAHSAGRRLPGWSHNSPNIITCDSSLKARVSLISDDNSIDCSVQGQKIESPNINLSDSWLFSRPLCRDPPKPIVPKLNFGGRIVYSRLLSEVEKASMELLQIVKLKKSNMEGRVSMGLDLEWKPFYGRVGEIPGKVAVLQICLDGDRCDVMHIIHSGIPPALQSLLDDESSVKVGVSIAGDAFRMRNDYNVNVRGIEDLSSIACQKLRPLRSWSLSGLCEKLTGKQVDKPHNIRCGNWEVENLSILQLRYAATDAYASWFLYEALKSLPAMTMANSKQEGNH